MPEITFPNTGEINRRITIREWNDIPSPISEGITQSLSNSFQCWAKRDPMRGVNYWNGAQVGEEITDIFWIRYAANTKPEDLGGQKIIEFNGSKFRIIRAISAGDANQFTMIWAKDLGKINA